MSEMYYDDYEFDDDELYDDPEDGDYVYVDEGVVNVAYGNVGTVIQTKDIHGGINFY